MLLHGFCNERCDIYVDEDEIGHADKSGTWSRTIPRTSRLIAVEDENNYRVGVMAFSASNGFQSSEEWTCSEDGPVGWTRIDYDDSEWGKAVLLPSAMVSTLPKLSHIREEVLGVAIWTENRYNRVTIECRGKIGECQMYYCM